jgi:hypothetical protein
VAGGAERRGSWEVQDVESRPGVCINPPSYDAVRPNLTSSHDVCHHSARMRTTLNLDDDALEMVRQYSEARSVALGKAASELVRKGFVSPTPTRVVNGILVFDVPLDSPRITTERAKELESELE